MEPHVRKPKKNKKKKKGNFLKEAKFYGKKGQFGRGKRLSEEEYNYYIRVFEQLKHVEGEDKEILVRNIFRELSQEGQQRSRAGNQVVSRLLDELLPLADTHDVLALAQVFGEDMRALCVDPFASHVMQTLVALALKYSQKTASQKRWEENEQGEAVEKVQEVPADTKTGLENFLKKMSKFVYNNLEDFVRDTYASHVVCSVLMTCSGRDVSAQIDKKKKEKTQSNHGLFNDDGSVLESPQELKDILKKIVERFTQLPGITDIITSNHSSVVVQTLLLVTRDSEVCGAMVDHVTAHGLNTITRDHCDTHPDTPPPDNLPGLFLNNSALRLMEVLLSCATSEKQKQIYDEYFKGNMNILIENLHSNFVVQRILTTWKAKTNFSDVFEEVGGLVGAAVEAGRWGVVHSLVRACRTLSSHEGRCMEELMKVMRCQQPGRQVHFAPAVLRLLHYDDYTKMKAEGTLPPVALQGSLIVQDLLQFARPLKVVFSMLEMSSSDLQTVACDLRGCHTIKSFYESTTVGVKNKEKLSQKFKGTFTALACNKSGSRSLEDMWRVAGIQIKTDICSELVGSEMRLKDNQYGKYIYQNFMVSMFKLNDKKDWQELVEKKEKKRKMLDDLVKEAQDIRPKKKKKKSKDIEDDDIFIDTAGDIEDEEGDK